jgi:hypothetical protein
MREWPDDSGRENMHEPDMMHVHTLREKQGGHEVVWLSWLRENFVERALRLLVRDGQPVEIHFSSYEHGTAHWFAGVGIVEAHRWEDEDDLEDASFLARRYPAAIEDGFVSPDHAVEKTIPDVLRTLPDRGLAAAIGRLVQGDDDGGYDWAALFTRLRGNG